jgi:hypothetical protein
MLGREVVRCGKSKIYYMLVALGRLRTIHVDDDRELDGPGIARAHLFGGSN